MDSSPEDIAAILARIPALAGTTEPQVQPLEGGPSLNNANFLVRSGERDEYVLRVATPTAVTHLGVRWEEEIAAARAAADAGLAPEVLYADPAPGTCSPGAWPAGGTGWRRNCENRRIGRASPTPCAACTASPRHPAKTRRCSAASNNCWRARLGWGWDCRRASPNIGTACAISKRSEHPTATVCRRGSTTTTSG